MENFYRNLRWERENGFRHDVVGGALQMIGSLWKAGAEKQAAEYNTVQSEAQAQAARVEAQYRADRILSRTNRILGAQRAAYSANGVTLEGSPSFVARDTAIEGAMDELAVLRSGETRAMGLDSQAQNYRRIGRNALWMGLNNAGGAGLSTASRMDWGANGSGPSDETLSFASSGRSD